VKASSDEEPESRTRGSEPGDESGNHKKKESTNENRTDAGRVEYVHDGKLRRQIRIEANVRKHFDPAALKELEATIKKEGVIQSIIVRAMRRRGITCRQRGAEAPRRSEHRARPDPGPRGEGEPEALLNLQMSENLHRADLGRWRRRGLSKPRSMRGADHRRPRREVQQVRQVRHAPIRLLELRKAAVRAIEKDC